MLGNVICYGDPCKFMGCYVVIGLRRDKCPCGGHGKETEWPYVVKLFPFGESPQWCANNTITELVETSVVVFSITSDWEIETVYGDHGGTPLGGKWDSVCVHALTTLAKVLYTLSTELLLRRINQSSDHIWFMVVQSLFPRTWAKEKGDPNAC